MAHPTRGKRKRACDNCRQRKIHCDAAPSQCNWCQHQGLLCTYTAPSRRGKRAAAAGSSSSSPVVENPGDGETSPRVGGQPLAGEATFPAEVHTRSELCNPEPSSTRDWIDSKRFAGVYLGGVSSYNGIPFFSEASEQWILSRTGSSFTRFQLHALTPPWQRQESRSLLMSPPDGSRDLPDRKAVEAYFTVFFKSSIGLVFPIVDISTFMGVVERAYGADRRQGTAQSLEVVAAKACVLSFTSILVLMQGQLDGFDPIDMHRCARRAQLLLSHIFTEATPVVLQVCAMQAMYNLHSGDAKAATIFHAMSCRLVTILGAHLSSTTVEPPSEGPAAAAWAEKRYIRRVFWLCYMNDKDISLRMGSPPVLDDDHCNLELPPGYKCIDNFDSFQDCGDLFPGDVRLSIIKSLAIRTLFSAKASKKSDAELLQGIRELDDELEKWRLSIPPQYRPTLAPSYRIQFEKTASKPKKMHIIIIHLEYFSLVAIIHSFGGRCQAWMRGESFNLSGMVSSQAIALQASRATILNLQAVSHVLNWGDFWIIVYYPISASLSLFCNILLSPLNPQAEEDAAILRMVPAIIRGLPTQMLTKNEILMLQPMEEFIAELGRLVDCARLKASQGS